MIRRNQHLGSATIYGLLYIHTILLCRDTFDAGEVIAAPELSMPASTGDVAEVSKELSKG